MSTAKDKLELSASRLADHALTVITLAQELVDDGTIDEDTFDRVAKDCESGYPSFAESELEHIMARRLILTQIHTDQSLVSSTNEFMEVV